MKNGLLKYWLKKIFYHPTMRVKRFFDYAPLIWKDEDYDWSYIMYMLKYKIKRTREHIDEHKIFEGYEYKVSEMLEAEQMIERILKQDWLSDEFDAHMKKYPTKWQEKENGDMFVESTHDKPEGAEFRAINERRRVLEKADWDRLGYLISNCLQGWWD